MATCERRYVDVEGIQTHYLEAGEGPATLLLIHGGGVSSCAELNYGSVMELLAQHLRVVALDVVGFGRTRGGGPMHYTARAQGDFVLAFMEKLNLQGHVGGNSHGGWLAQYVAHERPQAVKRLIIINSLNGTQPIPPAPEGNQYIYSPVGHAHHDPTRERIHAELCAFYVNQKLVTEARVARTLEIARSNHAYAKKRARATSSTVEEANENLSYRGRSMDQWAPQLSVPVLMTWSRENRGSHPSHALAFYERLVDGEMHIFSGAGHHVMTEHPRRWTQVVWDFLCSER